MSEYESAQQAEADSWILADPRAQAEKLRRERMRHHRMIKDLLLDHLGTHDMDVMEVGGGPLPISDLLPFRSRLVIDPLSTIYAQIAPCPDHMEAKIEDDPYLTDSMDLIIATNSLDHVENVQRALQIMDSYLRYGGYMAILCAENNAIINPHPAHKINLTARDIHNQLDATYETVWEKTWQQDGHRYGWKPYEGRCGQPAFALLMRKAIVP